MKKVKKMPGWGTAVACLAMLMVAVVVTVLPAARADTSLRQGPIDLRTVEPALALGRAYAMVAAHVKPCVVSVYSERMVKHIQPEFSFPFGNEFFRQFFGQDEPGFSQPKEHEYSVPERGMGSGMILDREGHILTNYHVIRDVDHINVQLADKRNFEAEVVGTDPKTDVAVIRIKGHLPSDLPTVVLGDSDAEQVGGLVIAIGAPFGLQQTVTEGIISATGRSDVGIADYEDFIQTDAPINPGNSGGPLVNMKGEVIGMNSAIATSVGQFAGVGFSIPSNMIKAMLPVLMKGEKIVRGQLGVVIQEMTPELAKSFGLPEARGVLVSKISRDSPAERAGFKVGDVIERYAGKDVDDVHGLRNLVSATLPGTRVEIGIFRNGKEEQLTAVIGKQEENAGAAGPSSSAEPTTELSKLGLRVQTLTPSLANQLGTEGEKGVVITDVEEGGPASFAGLQKGDVIIEVDRRPVADAKEFELALTKAKNQDSVLLLIRRQEGNLFIELPLK